MNLSLDDVADYLEQWKKYDNYGMALCCWHDDHAPSLRVTIKGYKCLSCGAHGSLEKLYEKVSGRVIIKEKTYNKAALVWKRWEERFGSIQSIAKIANQELQNAPDLGHYLQERKIDSEIKNGMFGYLDGYYTFPIKNEWEEVQGIIARASPTIQNKNNRYTVSSDCPIKLYVPHWRKLLKAECLYLCYGTIDAWSLCLAGYDGFTGISGQEINPANLERFRKPIYIIPDRGEEKKAIELQMRLGWRGKPLFLEYPEGIKDLNGVHMKFGLEKIQELIEKQRKKYTWQNQS